ncbi:MAG: response regulator transcription factor [Chloroflexi bacterium]|nr:response regulator transcription factor [Chloroflexota bacterium]
MSVQRARVLIVDDHPVVRKGIRAVLEAEPSIEVVGEASNGLEALKKCGEISPDVLFLDISMPVMNGLEASGRIKAEYPNTKVILLTMHEEDEYFFQALSVGASGYMIKGAKSEELVMAIQSVMQGGVYLQPSLAKELVTDYLRTKAAAAYDGLTQREAEVLQHIAEGFTNKQIAEQLYISITTVQTHRAHLMEKLDLHTQAELIKYAIKKGILKPSQ